MRKNGTFLKKKNLLTSKRQLDLHIANFHLGVGCEERLHRRNHLIFNKLETVAMAN